MALTFSIGSYFDQLIYTIGNYHYNWHPAVELLMPLKGTVVVNVDGYQYRLAPADLIAINTNQGHATLATQPDTVAIRTQISPQFFQDQGVQLSSGEFNLNTVNVPHHPAYRLLRQAIAQLYFANQPLVANSAGFLIAALLYEHFFIPTRHDRVPHQHNSQFTRVAQDIQTNYRQDLSLEILAKRYGYSKLYFSKLFKQYFGIGFHEFLTRERLQHALSELNSSSDQISTVALNNGFTEVKSFNLAFKKHFGITPSDYQEKSLPQAAAVDAHFQEGIDEHQLTTAKQALHELLTVKQPANGQTVDCENCGYRQDSQHYHVLRQKLADLLNDNN